MTLSEHGKAWTKHVAHTKKWKQHISFSCFFFVFLFCFFVANKKSYALKVKPTLRDTTLRVSKADFSSISPQSDLLR